MVEHGGKYLDLDAGARIELGTLICDHRQAVLATIDGAAPYAAMTAFAPQPNNSAFLLHLSDMGAHKWHLRANPKAGLIIFEPDDGKRDVLQHRRLTLTCSVRFIDKDSEEYETASRTYLDRFPKHQITFQMKDFDLVELVPRNGLLNAGFGRAFRVTRADLAAAADATR